MSHNNTYPDASVYPSAPPYLNNQQYTGFPIYTNPVTTQVGYQPYPPAYVNPQLSVYANPQPTVYNRVYYEDDDHHHHHGNHHHDHGHHHHDHHNDDCCCIII